MLGDLKTLADASPPVCPHLQFFQFPSHPKSTPLASNDWHSCVTHTILASQWHGGNTAMCHCGGKSRVSGKRGDKGQEEWHIFFRFPSHPKSTPWHRMIGILASRTQLWLHIGIGATLQCLWQKNEGEWEEGGQRTKRTAQAITYISIGSDGQVGHIGANLLAHWWQLLWLCLC